MTEKTKAKMNAVFMTFGLNKQDHVEKYGEGETMFTLINKDGIMLIKSQIDIDIELNLVHTNGTDEAVVKASTVYKRKIYQTFGEVNPANNTFGHPVNVAEKRAMSRLVLDCVGLYESDFLGSDEFHGNPLAEAAKPKRKRKTSIRSAGSAIDAVIKKTSKKIATKKVTNKNQKLEKPEFKSEEKKGPEKSGKEIAKDMLSVKQVGSAR